MPIKPTDEEERYFREIEADRRASLRRTLDGVAEKLQERRRIGDILDSDDLDVAGRIRALGFDGDSARVFDLLPLVHVAWADGSVQRGERAMILKILESRGIERESAAFELIETLLEERPSDAYMTETLLLLRSLVRDRTERGKNIVELCMAIAEASGGFFGFGDRVADEERQMIEKIANALGAQAQARFESELG
jgi:tellurite resistance protein